MTTAVSRFTTDVVSLDSFLFQRRGFLRKRSGFYWEYHLTRKDILTGLDFRLEREPDGSTALRFSHATNIDDGESTPAIYSVSIESTPCRHGARWWFRCPHLGDDGKPCGTRCRHLHFTTGQDRFACRRCAGIKYVRDEKNHNPVYGGFIRPLQRLQCAAIGLLRCRSPKRKERFRSQADAARKRIAEFSVHWRRIASRVVTGTAGVRDKRYFDKLSSLLLGSEIRDFVEANLAERTTDGQNRPEESPAIDVYALIGEMMEGGEELLASTYSQAFRSVGCDPTRQKLFALAAIMTCRLDQLHKHKSDEEYEDYALTCMASAEYIEDLAADPEALFDHVRFAFRIGKKQFKGMFANAS